MTREEAAKVLAMIRDCDGGCNHCVEDLLQVAKYFFPEVDWHSFKPEELPSTGPAYKS